MSERNVSPMKMFERLAAEHRPEFAFKGKTARDFAAWKQGKTIDLGGRMKLPLDQNLSFKLVPLLVGSFPGSKHIKDFIADANESLLDIE